MSHVAGSRGNHSRNEERSEQCIGASLKSHKAHELFCMLLARRAAHVVHRAPGPRRTVGILSAAMGLVHGKDAANTHEGAFTDLVSADILGKPVNFKAFEGKVTVVTNVASE